MLRSPWLHPLLIARLAVILPLFWADTVAPAAEPGPSGEANHVVRYEHFGAVGDGTTDDLPAIVEAHAHANQHQFPVRARDDATYYLGGRDLTATVETDTDFGSAAFIIDDAQVENRRAWIFDVRSAEPAPKAPAIKRLAKGQAKIDPAPAGPCLLIVTNDHVKRYIRMGKNQNAGKPQTDLVLVDQNGSVDPRTPVLWDFDTITDIAAYPIDLRPLTLTGGHFTTRANRAESKYTYYARGIRVRRSNVVVDGLRHDVTGEGDHGAPYSAFVYVTRCTDVIVRNGIFTARKTYTTVGRAGKPVPMGSYDLQANLAANVSFIDCEQTNDLDDRRYWGIMASNYSKNLSYLRCQLSRFDAHQGVYNATLRDSTIGHAGIQLIGHGTFRMENVTVRSTSLVTLRRDYGSTWEGEFIIRDCVLAPPPGRGGSLKLITGGNAGQHDFGYPCFMPARITFENLRIDDARRPRRRPGARPVRRLQPEAHRRFVCPGSPLHRRPHGHPPQRHHRQRQIPPGQRQPIHVQRRERRHRRREGVADRVYSAASATRSMPAVHQPDQPLLVQRPHRLLERFLAAVKRRANRFRRALVADRQPAAVRVEPFQNLARTNGSTRP